MPAVKTAISIKEPLFNKLDRLAHDLNVSRSKLLSIALEEFIERYENLQLLEALNAAYGQDAQKEEIGLSAKHKEHYRDLVEGSW